MPVVDQVPPRVTIVSPSDGASDIPTNAVMRIRFSERIDPTTVTPANFFLYPTSASSVVVAGAIEVSPDGLIATFRPATDLQPETQYGVFLTGIADLVGQGLSSGNGTYARFTTGVGGQPPVHVSALAPPSGATGVPVNPVIQVQFSGPISTATVGAGAVTVTTGVGNPVAGTVTPQSSTVITFAPTSVLAVSTTYTVTVDGVTDLTGQPVAVFTGTFTTLPNGVPDTVRPTVTAVSPANGSLGASVTEPVVVTFSEPVNPVTVHVSSLTVRASGFVVAGTYGVSGGTVTFTPAAPLPPSTTVTVSVSTLVTDLAGNASQGFSSSFTTAATVDTTAPTVVAVTPVDGATGIGSNGQVVLTFSESMHPNTLLACCSGGFYTNVAVFAGGTRRSFSPSVSADNRTLVLAGLSLPAASLVSVVVTSGATDLAGNGLVDFTSQFTTAAAFDTTHATVTSQRPGNGATGVARSSPVTLFVSEPLQAATVGGALHVTENGLLVDGAVMVTGTGQTIAFVPATPWADGAVVQVFLDATALDLNGTTVTAYQGTFTVRGDPATTAPAIVALTPANGTTGVPLNAVVAIGYSSPLDAAT